MTPRILTLVITVFFSFTAEASASPDTAHPEVTLLHSASFGGVTVRALIKNGETQSQFILERVDRSAESPARVTARRSLPTLAVGKESLGVRTITSIEALRVLSDHTVHVRLRSDFGDIDCRASMKAREFSVPTCARHQSDLAAKPATPSTQARTYGAIQVDWSTHSAVIAACEAEFSGLENERTCLRAVRRASSDPLPALRECTSAMAGDEDELRCLAAAVRAEGAGAQLVRACAETIDGDDHEAKCIEAGRRAHRAGPDIVKACGDMLLNDLNELTCITWASPRGALGLEAVRACDAVMKDDDQQLACVGAALRAEFATAPLIRACGRMAEGDEIAAQACIQHGSRAEVDPLSLITACHDRKSDGASRVQCVGEAIEKDTERRIRQRSRQQR